MGKATLLCTKQTDSLSHEKKMKRRKANVILLWIFFLKASKPPVVFRETILLCPKGTNVSQT
jgi:hypothetical protein